MSNPNEETVASTYHHPKEVADQLTEVMQKTGLSKTMLINKALVQYYNMKTKSEALKAKVNFKF